MHPNARALVLAALVALAAGPAWAQGKCGPQHKIDSTTVDDARRKIEAAGYQQVQDLRKGCDNFWHGQARRNGAPVNVVVSPQGEVMIEGD